MVVWVVIVVLGVVVGVAMSEIMKIDEFLKKLSLKECFISSAVFSFGFEF